MREDRVGLTGYQGLRTSHLFIQQPGSLLCLACAVPLGSGDGREGQFLPSGALTLHGGDRAQCPGKEEGRAGECPSGGT